jgi:NAD(P)-dependent dehydrogenase (short-subunit alcohol dehydrogenase family)
MMAMWIDLNGLVVVVTGAGRGIGREHALALAKRGASVVVNDLGGDVRGGGADHGPAATVVSEIATAGGSAVADGSDAGTREGAARMVDVALKRFGRIDAVVSNAGITGGHELFADTPDSLLERMFAVHVRGPWALAQEAWPHFMKQGRGRIIFTSSSSWLGAERASAYATTKAALIGLTRTLALEGAPHGILVNAIAPMALSRMSAAEVTPAMAERMSKTIPTDSVSPAVVAMVSREWTASGEIYHVGGGHLARFFIGQTRGVDNGARWAPEDALASASAVYDETGSTRPRNDFESSARYALGTEDLAGLKFHSD